MFKVRCSIEFDERNMPRKGVYVANHVSFLDPVLLFAFLPGDPVFALNGHLYRNRLIRFLMRTADVMPFNPIEPGDIKELIAKVDGGRLCVIFAEGRVTESAGAGGGQIGRPAHSGMDRGASVRLFFQDQRQTAAPAAAESAGNRRPAAFV